MTANEVCGAVNIFTIRIHYSELLSFSLSFIFIERKAVVSNVTDELGWGLITWFAFISRIVRASVRPVALFLTGILDMSREVNVFDFDRVVRQRTSDHQLTPRL